MMKLSHVVAVVSAFTATAVWAEAALEPVVVTAARQAYRDVEAPFSSEVHSRSDIEGSGALTLYDYLDRYTAVNVMPSYGNRATPRLDMRGFGLGNGYQNLVITMDGRRLNNIDMVPQLLGGVPLTAIDRIEIVRGSGSVTQGDGATAGAIHIRTRDITGLSGSVTKGSHGLESYSVAGGAAGANASISATTDHASDDGLRDPDTTGQEDESDSRNTHALLRVYPGESMELRAGKEESRIDTVYGSYLTKAQFDDDPAQNGGLTYTAQEFESNVTSLGLTAEIASALRFTADHHLEDKRSAFPAWSTEFDYDYRSDDFSLQYGKGPVSLIAGWQLFDGERSGSDASTGKENRAWYLRGHYRDEQTTYSAGMRSEQVEYSHSPASGAELSDDRDLRAYDFGINHRVNERVTLFANYNRAYQAPDIDRFFTTDWMTGLTTFNGFIKPAVSHTWNVGINHIASDAKLKISLFHSELQDEIYYFETGPWSGFNTNIDKSHKYGVELQETRRINDRLSSSLLYAYTRAVIDEEDEGSGAFDGSELPGVSPHALTLGFDYQPDPGVRLSLTHNWRSEAYAANDFANTGEQKQAAYESTDLAYSYRQERLEWFIKVENLFDQANGLWIADDVIYPVNFERSWHVGVRAKL